MCGTFEKNIAKMTNRTCDIDLTFNTEMINKNRTYISNLNEYLKQQYYFYLQM